MSVAQAWRVRNICQQPVPREKQVFLDQGKIRYKECAASKNVECTQYTSTLAIKFAFTLGASLEEAGVESQFAWLLWPWREADLRLRPLS